MTKNNIKDKKTYIGVLSSHDEIEVNRSLINVLDNICLSPRSIKNFHFIFTEGTFKRVFEGDTINNETLKPVRQETRRILLDECGVTVLPGFRHGGVTIMSYFITSRLCSIIWPFFSPIEHHWRRPENLAQWRLCDQWNVKRLANAGSVYCWYHTQAEEDAKRNLQTCPPQLMLRKGAKDEAIFSFKKEKIEFSNETYEFNKTVIDKKKAPVNFMDDPIGEKFLLKPFEEMTVALIAHDEMKQRMISFAIDHEWELEKFATVLATGTTGREVAAVTSNALGDKIYRYHSGPKGGDIEIATEILFQRCHVVFFFVDPLHPHPHIDDIRTVFEACMIRKNVLIFTNEMHAREFMSKVVRGKEYCSA